MEIIADLEIHSKYSRACSPDSDLEHHQAWAEKKGIEVIGTGDFTQPVWFKELADKLDEQPAGAGLFGFKEGKSKIRFMLTCEVSCIFSKGGKVRRIHVLLFAPNLAAAEKLNKLLTARGGKLGADGRPILGMDVKTLLELALTAHEKFLVIPAHVWTPWFGYYGSKSGFDSLKMGFEDLSDKVLAVETGLSSDPSMNWRIKELDNKAIVSFSDAHSPQNLGREATVFKLAALSYENVYDAIKNGYRQTKDRTEKNSIAYTIEFYPEEGKYHYDGHRDCGVMLNPEETKRQKGKCPKCGKNLTVGVMYRVDELAERKAGYSDKDRPGFKNLVQLSEIIADAFAVGKKSKKVEAEYGRLVRAGFSEFNILLNLSREELGRISSPLVAEGIWRVRHGRLELEPGYDGVYGRVAIFSSKEKEEFSPQARLF